MAREAGRVRGELLARPARVRRLLASRLPQELKVYSGRLGGLTARLTKLLLLYSSASRSAILQATPPNPLNIVGI